MYDMASSPPEAQPASSPSGDQSKPPSAPYATYRNEGAIAVQRFPVHWGADGSKTYVEVQTRYEIVGHHEIHQTEGCKLCVDSVRPAHTTFRTVIETPTAAATQTEHAGPIPTQTSYTQNVLVQPQPPPAPPPIPPAAPPPSAYQGQAPSVWGAPHTWAGQPPPGQPSPAQAALAWGSPPPNGWGAGT